MEINKFDETIFEKKEKIKDEIEFEDVKLEEIENENGFTETKKLGKTRIKIKLIQNNEATLGSPCHCSNRCFELFNDSDRQLIFENFWKIVDAKQQTEYFLNCFTKNKFHKKNTQFIVKNSKGEHVRICKIAFLSLHGLNKQHLDKFKLNKQIFLQNLPNDVYLAREFIRNSAEFKSCCKKRNINGCYKNYLDTFKNYDDVISESKFRRLFKKELDGKLKRMCRICLTIFDQDQLFDIFSYTNNILISQAIMDLASIQILEKEETFPKLICHSCLDKLNMALDLRQQCIESDKALRDNTVIKTFKKTQINNNNDEFKDFTEIKREVENFYDSDSYHSNDDQNGNDYPNEQHYANNFMICQNNNMEEDDPFKTIDIKFEIGDEKKCDLGIDNVKIYRQYEHQKNKIINKFGKVLGPPCGCPKNCYYLIGKKNIKYIFKKYWNLKRMNIQSSYLHSCIVPKEVECRTKKQESRRKYTFFYRIQINGRYIKICRKAFLNMHGISEKRVRTVVNQLIPNITTKINNKRIDQTTNKKEQLIQMDFDEENVIEKDEKEMTKDEDIPDDMMPTYKCEICAKVFIKERTYKYHKVKKNHFTNEEILKKQQKRNHKPNEKGEYTCADCGKIFIDSSKYRYHVGYYHSLKHTCEKCGQIFDNIRKFRNHMYRHTGIRHLSCDICGRTYYSVDILGKHKKLKHSKEQQQRVVDNQVVEQPSVLPMFYNCTYCAKSFAHMNMLNEHIANKHTRVGYFDPIHHYYDKLN